jgi:D-alanyl-lipoteichoic acid acyltransferase DltB (MBOAT superfamily)
MPILDLHNFFQQFLYDAKNPLLFNNGFFVFFFALFLTLYYYFRNNTTTRKYIFIFFSLYFFYKASGYFVLLVILSAIVDFLLSNAIFKQNNKAKKKALLIFSILFNLGLLFYFKYTNFFIEIVNNLFLTKINLLNILLPVGISFYTFENLSYTIDVYRGEFEPAKKFSDYLLFLSFFPKLVMGPIVRAHDFVPQINKPYLISEEDFTKGFYLIFSGLFKKLIISDYITLNYVNFIFDAPARYSGLENLFAVYGYAIVIYCDFSGYSDIAIGIARWLGFKIPANFLSPYQSVNITDFWRRWHISLSSWLKDYLYIPLGGNRNSTFISFILGLLFLCGSILFGIKILKFNLLISVIISFSLLLIIILPAIFKRNQKLLGANLNLLSTMMLGGFWHGASLNFVIWGSLHGLSLAIHKLWMLLTEKANVKISKPPIVKVTAVLITFHFVCFCWIFFKAPDIESAMSMIHQIFFNFNISIWWAFFENYKNIIGMIALGYALHVIPDDFIDKLISNIKFKVPFAFYVLIFFLFLMIYSYFKSAEPVLPIYLQF